MAKKTKHRSSALALRPATVRPIVIRTKEVRTVRHKSRHHRRHHGGALGGLMTKERMGIVGGALIVGFLEKQGLLQQLPALPVIGRLGTIAVGAAMLSDGGRNKLADEVATAAAVLAAHSLGSTGSIVGDAATAPDLGYVAGW